MKRFLVILAALLGLSCSTWADQPGNNGNGQGGCGQGQQTNGCPGQGGAGGSGGNAYAAAIAGAVSSSVAEGGRGGSSSSNAAGGQSQAVGTVTVNGDSYEAARIPVATAYAAPLAAANGTCMGSTSAGVQGMSAGLSFGTTWTDNGCDARYDATALVQAGQPKAAIARLCLKAEIAQAMKAAGTPCPGTETTKTRAEAILDGEPAAQVAYTDPIVRTRLGLPPLSK